MEPPDWRKPYRTMDESGTADSAGRVAKEWIDGIATAEFNLNPWFNYRIEYEGAGSCKIILLYGDNDLIAAATLFRDEANFTVLIRWLAEGIEPV